MSDIKMKVITFTLKQTGIKKTLYRSSISVSQNYNISLRAQRHEETSAVRVMFQ
jgi:hypothetical protein